MLSKKGALVVVEGIDGAGKSTLVDGLVAECVRRGRAVGRRAFPTRGAAGRLARALLSGAERMDPHAMLWVLAADAVDAAADLRDSVALGALMVCDRDVRVSGRVYQSDIHSDDEILQIMPFRKLPTIDHLLLLDVEPAEAEQRIEARGRKDTLEHGLARRRDRYLELAKAAEVAHPGSVTILRSPPTAADALHRALWALDGRGLL